LGLGTWDQGLVGLGRACLFSSLQPPWFLNIQRFLPPKRHVGIASRRPCCLSRHRAANLQTDSGSALQ